MRKNAVKHRSTAINTTANLSGAIQPFVPSKKKLRSVELINGTLIAENKKLKATHQAKVIPGTKVNLKSNFKLSRKTKRTDNRFDKYNIKGI